MSVCLSVCLSQALRLKHDMFEQKSPSFHLFIWFDSFRSSQQVFSHVRTGLNPGLNKYKAEFKVSCSRSQRSASSEAGNHNPSISSQALYHLPPRSSELSASEIVWNQKEELYAAI